MKDGLYGPRWVQHGILETAASTSHVVRVPRPGSTARAMCRGIAGLQGTGLWKWWRATRSHASNDTASPWRRKVVERLPGAGGLAVSCRSRLPDRILHAWLVTRKETHRPGKRFLHRNQECGFYSLFYLARAFSKRAEGKSSHWIVLGNGAVSIRGEPVPYPDKATVLGPCAVIPRELPGVTCAYVDVALPVASMTRALLTESWRRRRRHLQMRCWRGGTACAGCAISRRIVPRPPANLSRSAPGASIC